MRDKFARVQRMSTVQTIEQVVPRLTGQSSDSAILEGSLACIATADFSNDPLAEVTEHTYFNVVLKSLPAPYNSPEQQQPLRQSVTVKALV